jgi:hypothetical protein
METLFHAMRPSPYAPKTLWLFDKQNGSIGCREMQQFMTRPLSCFGFQNPPPANQMLETWAQSPIFFLVKAANLSSG